MEKPEEKEAEAIAYSHKRIALKDRLNDLFGGYTIVRNPALPYQPGVRMEIIQEVVEHIRNIFKAYLASVSGLPENPYNIEDAPSGYLAFKNCLDLASALLAKKEVRIAELEAEVEACRDANTQKKKQIRIYREAFEEVNHLIPRDNPENEWEKGYTAAVIVAKGIVNRAIKQISDECEALPYSQIRDIAKEYLGGRDE